MWGLSDIEMTILATMFIPCLATLGNMVIKHEDYRDAFTFAAACATFLGVLSILWRVGSGTTESFALFDDIPGIAIAFNVIGWSARSSSLIGVNTNTPGSG